MIFPVRWNFLEFLDGVVVRTYEHFRADQWSPFQGFFPFVILLMALLISVLRFLMLLSLVAVAQEQQKHQ